MLSNAIENLASSLNIKTPQADSKGWYFVSLDDGSEVAIHQNKNSKAIVFSCPLPYPEADDKEKALKELLQYNLVRMKDYSSSLTWDPQTQEMLLVRQLMPEYVSNDNINEATKDFLNDRDFWLEAIEKLGNGENGPV